MKIYKARLGSSPQQGMATDTWLVRASNFTGASDKAIRTAAIKAKDYTHHVELLSIELVGEEA